MTGNVEFVTAAHILVRVDFDSSLVVGAPRTVLHLHSHEDLAVVRAVEGSVLHGLVGLVEGAHARLLDVGIISDVHKGVHGQEKVISSIVRSVQEASPLLGNDQVVVEVV